MSDRQQAIPVPDNREEAQCAAAHAELIRRAATEPEAFGQLYEAHYGRILNYLYHRTLDVNVAEELTSNTFFKALRGMGKFRRGSFGAWLYRIATNEVNMHWRSRKKRGENDPVWLEQLRRIHFASRGMETPEDVEETMRSFAVVRQCMLALPQRYQTVLILRYFEGLPYGQIAEVLGKRLGTVKSLIHRGLKRLRRMIEDENATFPRDLHLSHLTGGDGDEEQK